MKVQPSLLSSVAFFLSRLRGTRRNATSDALEQQSNSKREPSSRVVRRLARNLVNDFTLKKHQCMKAFGNVAFVKASPKTVQQV
jgi:hypothetical protein